MSDEVCKVCEKPGHIARECKAPFRKRWPGKPAMKMLLRYADGSRVELVCALSEELCEQAAALQLAAFKRDGK